MGPRRRSPTQSPRRWASFRRAAPVLAAALLCGCATTAPGGRAQVTAPGPLSALYSSLEMGWQLATATVAAACAGLQCRTDAGFEKQVDRLGERLSAAAFEAYPELKERVPAFAFSVADKGDPGTASDASGSVVVYRGVRQPGLDETGLAYLMGREMGHVIARHHEEKSAVAVVATVLAQMLVPVAGLAPGMAFLATSAVSRAGTEVMAAEAQSDRLLEADAIGLALLLKLGWQTDEVAESLARYTRALGEDPWSQTLRQSLARLGGRDPALVLAAGGN